ncbi:MAG: hypothetical protein ACFCUE_05220 [Candidatus Bathyarchaeia archaeon]
MQKKPIRLTRHAVERSLKYDLDPGLIEKLVWEGKKQKEGKTKTRYALRTKTGVWVAVCQESSEQVIIITITKGR